MQDNIKYQQALVNKGWRGMSILLDKEIPQSGKRRRTAVWWLLGAGVVLILSGWGYFVLQENISPLPSTPETVPSQTVETVMVPERADLHEPEDIAAANLKSPEADAPISYSVSSDKRASTAVSLPAFSAKKAIDSPNIPALAGDGAVDDISNISSHPTETVAKLHLHETDMIIPETDLAGDNERRNTITIAELSPRIPAALDARFTIPSIAVQTSKAGNAFGLEVIAATHVNADGNPFYGVETGLNTTLRTGRRLNLNAGVSYGYYNVDGLGILGIDKDLDLELQDNQNTPGQNTGVLYDVTDLFAHSLDVSEVKQLTEEFHYIHFPVSVAYLITPRLSAAAGMKISALISAPARYQLNDSRFTASSLNSSSKSFLVSYDVLRKWDIAPIVNLTYRMSRHLSIDASYAHGLVHYVNSSGAQDKSDLHRSGSIGVRYRIL